MGGRFLEEEEIEREFAEGKREYKIDQSKEAEERQKKMLQRKLENRAKFAASREARKKKVQPIDGDIADDDFVAVGVAVASSIGEGVAEGREVGRTAVFVGSNVATAMGSGSDSGVGVQAVNPPSMINTSRVFVYRIFIAILQV